MWIILREVDHGSSVDLAAALRCQFAASRVAALVVFEQPAAVTRLRARRCMTNENAVRKVLKVPKKSRPLGPRHRLCDPGTALWTRRLDHDDHRYRILPPNYSNLPQEKKGMAGPKTPAKQAPATPNTAGASKRAKTQTVASTSSTASSAATSASKMALHTLWATYLNTTPSRLKLVDAFLVFLVLSGVTQFVHCVLVTSFPFNAFLAGCVLARFNSSHCD